MTTRTRTMVEEYEETFKKGTIVEVSSDDPGLRGSWYSATVVRSISRTSRKILVEYHNLFSDDTGSKPLREFVDAILVRPIPPREDPTTLVFRLMEDVDAYHNDGWWEGVVTNLYHQHHDHLLYYSVFFRCSREQIDFTSSDLRLHREWLRANLWVPPLDHHHPGQKRRNGDDRDDGRNGGLSGGANDQVTKNGDGKEAGRRNGCSPSKKRGGGSEGVVMNGGGRERKRSRTSSVSNGSVSRKKHSIGSSKVVHARVGVTRNGMFKEPTRRASNFAGRPSSRKR